MIAQQVGAKATRDTLFLSTFSSAELPKVMIAAAVLSVAAAVLVSRWLSRLGPGRVAPGLFFGSALIFFAEWALIGVLEKEMAVLVYLHIAGMGSVLISGYWSVVNESFDAREAKKGVMRRVAAGAALGGVLGGVLVERVAGSLDVASVLPLLGVLSAFTGLTIFRFRSTDRVSHSSPSASSSISQLVKQPYLRSLGLLLAFISVSSVTIDFALKDAAAAKFAAGADLMFFFAAFYTITSVLIFVVQGVLTPVALESGLGATIGSLPAAILIAGTLSLFIGGFWALAALGLVEAILYSSLFRTGYEVLYTPIPPEKKRATKTIIDVGFDRIGKLIGGALVMAAVAWMPSASSPLAVAGAVVAAGAALLLSFRMHRGYVVELAANLRSGSVQLQGDDVLDGTTRRTLAHTAVSIDRDRLLAEIGRLYDAGQPESSEIEVADKHEASKDRNAYVGAALKELSMVRELLLADDRELRLRLGQGLLDVRVVGFLIPLLDQDDIRRDIVHALRKVANRVEGQLIDGLLDSAQSIGVRRRLPSILIACQTQRCAFGLIEGLKDDDFSLRYLCGRALRCIGAENGALLPRRRTVFELASSELDVPRAVWNGRILEEEADRAMSHWASHVRFEPAVEHLVALLGMALDPEPLVLSFQAFRQNDQMLRGTALEYLENVMPKSVFDKLAFQLGVEAVPVRQKERARRGDLLARLLRSRTGPRV